MDTIPVERSGRDSSALRAALRALQAGRVLGVFPEGRIEKDRELLPFQSGPALLALRTGAPVFPAYLDGTQRGSSMLGVFLHAREVEVTFGSQITLGPLPGEGGADLEVVGKRIQEGVEALRSRRRL
jgi:1-acyl-sn-glycerol-3-phosphate acyltransferase